MGDLLGLKKTVPNDGIDFALPEARIPSADLKLPKSDTALKNLNLDLKLEANKLNTDSLTPGVLQTFMQTVSDGIRERKQLLQVAKLQKREQDIANLLEDVKAEVRRGDWKRAISGLDRLQAMQNSWEAVLLRAICLAGLGLYQEALTFVTEGSKSCHEPELQPAFTNLERQLRATIENLPLLQAQSAMMQGALAPAIAGFDLYLRAKPNRPDVLYMKAICHIYLGDFTGTRKACAQALSLSPEPKLAQAIKGLVAALDQAVMLSEAEQAIGRGDFRVALRLLDDPKWERDLTATAMKAVCRIRLGETREAEAIIKKLEQLDQGRGTSEVAASLRQQIGRAGSDALIKKAVEAMGSQDWCKAAQLLADAERMIGRSAESDPMLQFYLALARLRAGDLAGARVAMDRAQRNSADKKLSQQLAQMKTAIENQEEQAPMLRVIASMQKEDWNAALGELRSILRLDSKNANAYFHQALCHFHAMSSLMEGNQAKAREHYKEGTAALSLAEKHRGWRNTQLKDAIAKLKGQVGL